MLAIDAEKFAFPPTSLTNSEYIIVGIVLNPSPISIGVPKSANAFINTSKAPANIVGVIKGIAIVATFLKGEHPKLSAASIRETSILLKAPETYIKIKGYNFKVKTKSIPPKPYIVGVVIPKFAKNFVITPLLPSKSIQE